MHIDNHYWFYIHGSCWVYDINNWEANDKSDEIYTVFKNIGANIESLKNLIEARQAR